MVGFGIVLIVVSVVAVAIVTAMFLWGAREDGRDQKRVNERLARDARTRDKTSR